ncbi:HAD-IIIC family phosphatase [Nocardioides sp. GXZ039]|uniref:HAD-IIIC family phosphatase n=1 Tax=Nocardioides sp. GXZ039 TaxID=3136018 RepID=UPI0030F3F377
MSVDTVPAKPRQGRIKCVVWDLDHTLWDGVLLEDDDVVLRTELVERIRLLDSWGVLHTIASKNDADTAMAKLVELGIDDLFLCPQISWNPKSEAIRAVAETLNLGLDAFAFVDDQEFERAEVAHGAPEVTLIDAADAAEVLLQEDFRPRFVTDESSRRREVYRGQLERARVERDFVGTSEEFLASLDMGFVIETAQHADLQRAEELTVRTNQLNATGRTYSFEELEELRVSQDHVLLVASLTDRFGSYGTIGLALVEKGEESTWHLRMMLMSCRVMSRGVGTILLHHVLHLAREAGAGLRADLVETGRNRMMQVTYAFAGFQEIARDGSHVVLEADLAVAHPFPSYVRLEVRG